MVDQKQHKTPEELGEAVGKKIEELFGGMFGDEMPPEPKTPPAAVAGHHGVEPSRAAVPPVAEPPRAEQPPRAPVRRPPAPPQAQRPPAGPQMRRPEARQIPGKPAAPRPSEAADAFEGIIEQIEILILNLEWEVNPQSVSDLAERFRSLESFFPGEGQARTVLAMNRRGLLRFTNRDSVPHPALIKLLQDSVGVLKLIRSSQGKRPAGEALIAGLTQSYKEIMGASVPPGAAASSEGGSPAEQKRQYGTVVNNIGGAVHSLEEVNRRLARILGVLRQGGDMSADEVTRRLGTLEHLLTEHVGQLSSCHRELTHTVPSNGDTSATTQGKAPDGLIIVIWSGIHMAIPSSVVAALYPLTRAQAEQFMGKQTVTLGARQLHMLPLRRPQAAAKAAVQPTWLIHLTGGGGDYFLLADRSLGYRRTPEGIDIFRQAKIKMGPTSYAVLNHSALR